MKVAIAWEGLPFYGARLLRPIAQELGSQLTVIATQGPQSKREIEDELKAQVRIVDPQDNQTWEDLGELVPGLFFHTGWSNSSFRALAGQVKRSRGTVVCMIDNSCKRNLRQCVGKYVFRFIYRRQVDAALVPGRSGKELMSYFEMPETLVYTGMYGADPAIFQPGPQLANRVYDFLFAGQFIARKGIAGLIKAVRELKSEERPFRVAVVGDGPLKRTFDGVAVDLYPSTGAEGVARLMRDARFLVLPSIEDHWGVVVHEAALSGCGLILSRTVGSHLDLLTERNGFLCEPGDPLPAMRRALSADATWLTSCLEESRCRAREFGPDTWRRSFHAIYKNASAEDGLRTKPQSAPRP